LAGFRAFGKVSVWRTGHRMLPVAPKSPADSREIPVLGRLRVETGFDHDCRPDPGTHIVPNLELSRTKFAKIPLSNCHMSAAVDFLVRVGRING
jgi:hypothetical protein